MPLATSSSLCHFVLRLLFFFTFYGLTNQKLKLGDVARGMETVSRGLEVILQIWRLGGHYCGAHGTSALPPSSESLLKNGFISEPLFSEMA